MQAVILGSRTLPNRQHHHQVLASGRLIGEFPVRQQHLFPVQRRRPAEIPPGMDHIALQQRQAAQHDHMPVNPQPLTGGAKGISATTSPAITPIPMTNNSISGAAGLSWSWYRWQTRRAPH